jgi:hypothetical protein
MKNSLNQLIIIGSGVSIKEEVEKGLWEKLKYRFTIGLNHSYHFFEATCQMYVDSTFHNEIKQDWDKIPLIIGQGRNIKERPSHSLIIPCSAKYNRELKDGVYSGSLAGLYALSLAIYILDAGEIYLLGYDYGSIIKNLDEKQRKITHFYQEQIQHRGVGKTSWYDSKDRVKKDFGVYANESKVKIYNVSINSKIEQFEKMDYTTFFSKLDSNSYDQNVLRDFIKKKLHGKYT